MIKGALKLYFMHYLCVLFILLKSVYEVWDHSLSLAKFCEKPKFSYALKCTHTYVYQGVRNDTFSEDFANVLNDDPRLHKI